MRRKNLKDYIGLPKERNKTVNLSFLLIVIFYARNTTRVQLRLSVPRKNKSRPRHSYFSGHSQNYVRSFNQSDDRNLLMR